MIAIERKVALVTGVDGGIGRAVAEKLAEDGAAIVAGYHDDGGLAEKVVAEIEARGGRAVAVQFDQRAVGEIEHLFDEAETHFGGVDVVVAVAGITIPKPHAETDEEDYNALFGTNARSLAHELGPRRITVNTVPSAGYKDSHDSGSNRRLDSPSFGFHGTLDLRGM